MPRNNHDATLGESARMQAGKKSCVHSWSIEPPNGPTSLGTCVDCGATKEFRNSVEMSYWDNKRKHVPENLPPKKRPANSARAINSTAKKPGRQDSKR